MSSHNKLHSHHDVSAPYATPASEIARCAIDEDGLIIYASDAFQELAGLDSVQSTHIFDIFRFSDDVISDNGISDIPNGEHNVHLTGNPIISEFCFNWLSTADNRKFLIASAIDQAPIEDENGSYGDLDDLIARIHDSVQNVGSYAHENTVQPGENDLKAFIDMTHDVMIITDLQGQIITANDTFKRNFGYMSDPIEGLSFLSLFSQEDKPFIRSTLHGLAHDQDATSEHVITFESRVLTTSGEERWVSWRQKKANDRLYASGRDVTDIKNQKTDLQRRQRQLSEAEAIGRMGHWHWLIGDEGISWSEEIFRIFGVDQNHFKPRISSLTDLVHKRDLGRVVQVLQRAIIEEKNYDMEFRIVRPGGDIRYIMCEGRCEKDASGEVIALYGIMQDMTERMLYEQELRRAKDASEQAYAAKSRFLANMSHELRTPLNAIIGFSEMIESEMLGPIFNEKYVEYATSIRESGNHLLDLISDILDMSKIEAGKHILDLEEVNLKDVIDRATHMVQGRAAENGVNLKTDNVENSDLSIVADRRALTQIILNLLSNAVKFTQNQGDVWVECYPREDYVSVRICDTGIGIPPNKLASVLRPFEQVSSEYTREHEGSGLGLSITKELIELHGGTLLIDSTVNVGTTATIRLPYDAHAHQKNT